MAIPEAFRLIDPTQVVTAGLNYIQSCGSDSVMKALDLWVYQNRDILKVSHFNITGSGDGFEIRTSNLWGIRVVKYNRHTKSGSKYSAIDYDHFAKDIDFPHCCSNADAKQLIALGDSLIRILQARNICGSLQMRTYPFMGNSLLAASILIASRYSAETYSITLIRYMPHQSRTYKDRFYAGYRYLAEQRNQEQRELIQYDDD